METTGWGANADGWTVRDVGREEEGGGSGCKITTTTTIPFTIIECGDDNPHDDHDTYCTHSHPDILAHTPLRSVASATPDSRPLLSLPHPPPFARCSSSPLHPARGPQPSSSSNRLSRPPPCRLLAPVRRPPTTSHNPRPFFPSPFPNSSIYSLAPPFPSLPRVRAMCVI